MLSISPYCTTKWHDTFCRLASSDTQHCCSWGIYLGLDPGCETGRTGFCTPRTAPNAVQSAGASLMEWDGKPSTVLHRCALRPCRPYDGDGEEAPGGNGGSNHRQGLQIGGCQPHTSPGPWTRHPVAPPMCWCPTCRTEAWLNHSIFQEVPKNHKL
jgi:hypothetical protein